MVKYFRYLILLIILLTTGKSYSQNFSEWRGPGRTGIYSEEKNLLQSWPPDNPELLWVNDSVPKGHSSVAIANNLIYTTGVSDSSDAVIALNLKGHILWQTPYGRKWDGSFEESRSTPTVEGNRLYVSSGKGDVACIDAINGNIIWKLRTNDVFGGKTPNYGIAESLLLVDDKVIYTPGGDSTAVVALDKASGKTIWMTKTLHDNPSYDSPLLIEWKGKKIIATLTTNWFIGIQPSDGKIMWQFNFGSYAGGENNRNNQANTPLFIDGYFFLTSGYDHKSVKLKLSDMADSVSVVWVDSVLDVHVGGVVLIDGYLYGSNWLNNSMGNWACVNWETGKATYDTTWYNKGSIIFADGRLYCYEEKRGHVALVKPNPNQFDVVSTFIVHYGKGPYWSHPVIHNGILYLRHGNALMAYNIKKK